MVAAAKKRLKSGEGRGGQRANAGRPPKLDKDRWGRVTCVLRHDTIARLRDGAESRFFGEFLQDHLDRYPVPTRDQYLTIQRRGIPTPKAKVVHPWDDKQFSAEERFKLWCEHERERLEKEDEQIRVRLAREPRSLTEELAQEAYRRTFVKPLIKGKKKALGRRGPHNDKPGKIIKGKSLAHSKR